MSNDFTPKLRSTALPPRNEVLIRGAFYPNFLIPAVYCGRLERGMAVREGRIVRGKL